MEAKKTAEEIEWSDMERYGVDYTTRLGRCKHFTFDIRYDYEGNPDIKPEKCGLWLTVYFRGAKLKSIHGMSIESLTEIAKEYISEFKKEYFPASQSNTNILQELEGLREKLINEAKNSAFKIEYLSGLSFCDELLKDLLNNHKAK